MYSLPLPGLNICSSGSESDSNDDTANRRGKGKEGKRSEGSSSSSSSSKKRPSAYGSHVPPPAKLPKPEEIAAAFKDSKESEKQSAGFIPLPRGMQEKQRQGKTASSKHPEG